MKAGFSEQSLTFSHENQATVVSVVGWIHHETVVLTVVRHHRCGSWHGCGWCGCCVNCRVKQISKVQRSCALWCCEGPDVTCTKKLCGSALFSVQSIERFSATLFLFSFKNENAFYAWLVTVGIYGSGSKLDTEHCVRCAPGCGGGVQIGNIEHTLDFIAGHIPRKHWHGLKLSGEANC